MNAAPTNLAAAFRLPDTANGVIPSAWVTEAKHPVIICNRHIIENASNASGIKINWHIYVKCNNAFPLVGIVELKCLEITVEFVALDKSLYWNDLLLIADDR